MRNKIIADNIGITDFNKGSTIRSILECFALITSITGFDYLDALRKAIPVALFDGFRFKRKGATSSSGYFRFFRKPELSVRYIGEGHSALLAVTNTEFRITVMGSSDSFSLLLDNYRNVGELVSAVNNIPNFSAVLVGSADTSSFSLYKYNNVEIIGLKNWKNEFGKDILTESAIESDPIYSGTIITIDDIAFQLLEDSSILAGESTTLPLEAAATISGKSGNISMRSVDTLNGKGMINNTIIGVDYVVNDTAFTGGTDNETEPERTERFQRFIQGLCGSTKKGLEAAVLGIDGIRSVSIKECHPSPGYNTVIADDGTGGLSNIKKSEIQKVLDGDPEDIINYPGVRAAGIKCCILAPQIIPVSVSVTIFKATSLGDEVEIKSMIISAIQTYINTRSLGQDIILSEIIALGKRAHRDVYDIKINFPNENIKISDDRLARTGGISNGIVSATLVTLTSVDL